MRTFVPFASRAVIAAVPVFAMVLSAAPASAATVTWGAPTNISGDADVSTAGTLLGAFNVGSAGDATVNGVTFQGFVLNNGVTASGDFSFVTGFNVTSDSGSAAAPFSTLSAGYQGLLGTANVLLGNGTLTMSGLTVGRRTSFRRG
ncbi:MAG TPA: hypothetical protein VEA69_09720 [Tepidisphaeraceae bacterium]|nr:hypothetical protein [Tepidisphaeraceae bacterium]